MSREKKFNVLIIVSFVAYINIAFLLFFLIKDKDFSELENRNLAFFPKFTVERLLNKEFGDEFETYIADQFPLRNLFISIKSTSEYLLQKKENNGVYIANDNMFIEKLDDVDKDLIDKITSYINEFSSNFNTYVMIAPTSYTIYKDNLPMYVEENKELDSLNYFVSKLSSNITNIPLVESLNEHKDEYLYYKTDHHWTTLGAYYAYREFCNAYGLTPLNKSDFLVKTVSNDFKGTLFSKGNFTYAKPDDINLYYPKNDVKYVVDYVFSDRKTDSIYELSYLDKKDKYGVFLDNNHPLVKITTENNNNKKIAVIKDSYSHSLIPFLVNHFKEVVVIDLRLFKGNVNDYLKENDINDILIMYNVRNAISDRNIMRLR